MMEQKQVLPLIIISCFDVPLPTSFLSSAGFLSMSGMKPSSCALHEPIYIQNRAAALS
jgi:hypothetical protein